MNEQELRELARLQQKMAQGGQLEIQERQALIGLQQKAAGLRQPPRELHPGAGQGGPGSNAPASDADVLRGLVMGRFPAQQRPAALSQVGIAPSLGEAPAMQAMMALMKQNPRMEGAPPAPYETSFENKDALLDAFLSRTVDPRIAPQAFQSLTGLNSVDADTINALFSQ